MKMTGISFFNNGASSPSIVNIVLFLLCETIVMNRSQTFQANRRYEKKDK